MLPLAVSTPCLFLPYASQIFFETGNTILTTSSYHSGQKHLRYKPIALRIRRRMTPLLFLVGHYLSSCEKLLLDTVSTNSAPDWGCVASSARFDLYTQDQLFAAHYAWLFIQWIFNQILNKPTYAGSVERVMRGWNTAPLDSNALAKTLIHGNLPAIQQLLRLKDYTERKKWALNFLASLNPEQKSQKQSDWQAVWRDADMRDAEVPNKEQATIVLGNPTTMNDLWTKSARAALRDHGVELEGNELHGNAAATIRFLTDLAGLGIFNHENLPENLSEEGEEDDMYSETWSERRLSAPDEPYPPLEEEQQTMVAEQPEESGNYWDV